MSNRLDQKREAELQPKRIKYAIGELEKLGYETIETHNSVSFIHNGSKIIFFPYSGWFSGKTVKDGRGIRNLLKQLKK